MTTNGIPTASGVESGLDSVHAEQLAGLNASLDEIRSIVTRHQPVSSEGQWPVVEHLDDSEGGGFRVTSGRRSLPTEEYLWDRITFTPGKNPTFEFFYSIPSDGNQVPGPEDWGTVRGNDPHTSVESAYFLRLAADRVLEALRWRYEPLPEHDDRNWARKAGSALMAVLRRFF